MVYATQQDIIDRYGNAALLVVADRDGSGAVDADVVTKALADASTEIDTYLAARYALPLDAAPAALVQPCVDIAMYRMGIAPGAGGTEEQRTRYEDAKSVLKDISKGTASLGIESPAPTVGGVVTVSGPRRIFGRDKTGGIG